MLLLLIWLAFGFDMWIAPCCLHGTMESQRTECIMILYVSCLCAFAYVYGEVSYSISITYVGVCLCVLTLWLHTAHSKWDAIVDGKEISICVSKRVGYFILWLLYFQAKKWVLTPCIGWRFGCLWLWSVILFLHYEGNQLEGQPDYCSLLLISSRFIASWRILYCNNDNSLSNEDTA